MFCFIVQSQFSISWNFTYATVNSFFLTSYFGYIQWNFDSNNIVFAKSTWTHFFPQPGGVAEVEENEFGEAKTKETRKPMLYENSPDGGAFLASQPVPRCGAFCYLAVVARDPKNDWWKEWTQLIKFLLLLSWHSNSPMFTGTFTKNIQFEYIAYLFLFDNSFKWK